VTKESANPIASNTVSEHRISICKKSQVNIRPEKWGKKERERNREEKPEFSRQ
jgi:hypothetical protein